MYMISIYLSIYLSIPSFHHLLPWCRHVFICGLSADLLQHFADVLAPEDEEDDDDQQQDDGHQATNQNGGVQVWWVTRWWIGCCREGQLIRGGDFHLIYLREKMGWWCFDAKADKQNTLWVISVLGTDLCEMKKD